MISQSMVGYFEHIKNKIYIDKYPASIIRLDNLRDSIILEFGAGRGNDAKFLIESVGVNPANMFFIESDIFYFVDLVDNLENFFESSLETHFFPGNVLSNYYPNEFANFVYANNFLHCLGYKTLEEIKSFEQGDKVRCVFRETYRLLKENGIFFGRTLSDYVDIGCLAFLEDQSYKSEGDKFFIRTAKALQTGELIGISSVTLETYAREVGYNGFYSEIKPRLGKPVEDLYFRIEK